MKGQFEDGVVPYAPARVLMGGADEEVSPRVCAALVDKGLARHGDITIKLYPDATHDFDDPGTSRQQVPANVAARREGIADAIGFFAGVLKP